MHHALPALAGLGLRLEHDDLQCTTLCPQELGSARDSSTTTYNAPRSARKSWARSETRAPVCICHAILQGAHHLVCMQVTATACLNAAKEDHGLWSVAATRPPTLLGQYASVIASNEVPSGQAWCPSYAMGINLRNNGD